MDQRSGAPRELLGRRRECAALDGLVQRVKGGVSACVVVHGEPGIGKTALLDHVRDSATGCRVVRVAGVETEMELPFGGLHQLCSQFLDRFNRLPDPQRVALETAFGLSAGTVPDRFMVGLAVLSVVADIAEDEPLVCLVDDTQWLDQISAQTLAFVGRRLLAERVLLVFAMRDPVRGHPVQSLPQLEVTGLDDRDAQVLLTAVTPRRFDRRVRDRILAEAHGNPLAIIELPRALTRVELGGDMADRDERPIARQLETGFTAQIRALSPECQRLLLLAAAEPVGDVAVLRRAADAMGVDVDAARVEAEAADLVRIRTMVRFRHPLVRSAAYRSGRPEERHAAHRALAAAVDPEREPDRLAWHLASATGGPDEDIATGLEEAAVRARARGGVGAAAAFLDRAAQLTPDPLRRGARTLAAAQAKSQSGAFDEALALLDEARLQPLGERDTARADLVRGQVMFASRSASAGLPYLLTAAKQFEGVDPELAKETYRDALYAAFTAGQLPGGDAALDEVSAAALMMARAETPSRSDLLLEGVARIYTDGYAAGVPLLQRALTAYRAGGVTAADLGWLPLACRMAHDVWELEAFSKLSAAFVELTREVGALSFLPPAMLLDVSVRAQTGDFVPAQSLVEEAETLGDVIGSRFFAHYGALVVAAWQGREAATRSAIKEITHDQHLVAEGKVLTATEWGAAVLANGLGRHEQAYAAALRGAGHPKEMGLTVWSMVELVEAAARLGRTADADVVGAARHVDELTGAAGTDWALGAAAYVSALMSEGRSAEEKYHEAIERLERTEARLLTARAHLIHGEWLRQENRMADARRRLRVAHDLLTEIGSVAHTERARRELAASGVTVHPPVQPSHNAALTAQESRIARLAADGMTNPQIGAQLFISAHTVEWHLRKVFAKLGVRSRGEIRAALMAEPA
jgi:DNA-binding CsgD family transcriptional regulator/tetratricopeptide (TPR) repeat protein